MTAKTLRPLVALGATLTTLALTAGPALAVPAPEPVVHDGRAGSALPAPAAATTIPDTVSTAQVVAISLVTALIVGALLLVAAAVISRWARARRTAVVLPAQRDPVSMPVANDPVGAGG